jgi:drug/metabolite transporter (DMT)-like permease
MSEQFSTEQLKLKSNLTCMMSMILFASGFVAVESLLNAGWHPVYLNFLRHIMVVSLLIPIWIYFDGLKTLLGANWIWGIFVGGIGFGFGSLLLLYGQVFSDPITVTIVSGLFPAVSGFLEVLLDKRKLNKEFVIGVSIAFIGGTVVILGSENMVSVSWGALCTLLAVIFFSWASRANVIDFPDLSTLGQTSICMTGSCCFMFPAFVVMSYTDQLQPGSIFDMSEIELGQLMIYAILGMAVSQFFWISGIRQIGLGLASLHLNATPFYVMLIVVTLGGAWNNFQFLGAVIIGIGVVVSQSSKKSFMS